VIKEHMLVKDEHRIMEDNCKTSRKRKLVNIVITSFFPSLKVSPLHMAVREE
jgi:hypothetical protein